MHKKTITDVELQKAILNSRWEKMQQMFPRSFADEAFRGMEEEDGLNPSEGSKRVTRKKKRGG